MLRKLAFVAALAAVPMVYAVSASAEDFPATPMNSGAPVNLPGEGLIPGMKESMMIVNGVTQPILQPMLAPNGMAPASMETAAMDKPMMHHHHHHMMMKHKMMMHKKMMMMHKTM